MILYRERQTERERDRQMTGGIRNEKQRNLLGNWNAGEEGIGGD